MAFFKKIFWMLLCAVALGSCARYEDLRIEDGKVSDLNVSLFRGVDFTLEASVYNPGLKMQVTDLKGTGKISGKPVLQAEGEDFELPGHSTQQVRIPVKCSIVKGTGISDVMSISALKDPDNITVSIEGNLVGFLNIKRPFRLEDIPVSQFIKQYE